MSPTSGRLRTILHVQFVNVNTYLVKQVCSNNSEWFLTWSLLRNTETSPASLLFLKEGRAQATSATTWAGEIWSPTVIPRFINEQRDLARSVYTKYDTDYIRPTRYTVLRT